MPPGPVEVVIPEGESLPDLVRWTTRIARALAALHGQGRHADDLVGAARLSLHQTLSAFDPGRGVLFKVYARTRITFAVLDAIQAEQRHAELFDEALRALGDEDAVEAFVVGRGVIEIQGGDAGLLRREAHASLRREMALLPAAGRRLLELRYWQGLSRPAVAKALGMPESTVKDHERKLVARLGATLRALEGESHPPRPRPRPRGR